MLESLKGWIIDPNTQAQKTIENYENQRLSIEDAIESGLLNNRAGQIFLDGTQMFFSLHDPDPQLTGVIGVDGHIIQNVIRWQVCRIQHKASLRAAVPGKYVFCH